MKNNKGITLIALVVTIVVLIIISSVTWTFSNRNEKESISQLKIDELYIVQSAILQTRVKNDLTGKEYIGTSYNSFTNIDKIISEIESKTNTTIELKDNDSKNYYLLNINDLKKIGIQNSEDEFIVNYITGEVINATIKVTKNNNPLYISNEN